MSLSTISIASLLSHRSGLLPWLPLYADICDGGDMLYSKVLRCIAKYGRGIVYQSTCAVSSHDGYPRVYSDLNFIVLGIILHRVFNKPLDSLFDEYIVPHLENTDISFHPTRMCSVHPARLVPTSSGLPSGTVNDDNSKLFGGVSGHAGLFSSIDALHNYCRWIVGVFLGRASDISLKTAQQFIDLTHTLGWDRPSKRTDLRPSSCGQYFDYSTSVGHLAFTGPSIWIDLKTESWIILCCNRTVYSPQTTPLKQLRPIIHNLLYSIVRAQPTRNNKDH